MRTHIHEPESVVLQVILEQIIDNKILLHINSCSIYSNFNSEMSLLDFLSSFEHTTS